MFYTIDNQGANRLQPNSNATLRPPPLRRQTARQIQTQRREPQLGLLHPAPYLGPVPLRPPSRHLHKRRQALQAAVSGMSFALFSYPFLLPPSSNLFLALYFYPLSPPRFPALSEVKSLSHSLILYNRTGSKTSKP